MHAGANIALSNVHVFAIFVARDMCKNQAQDNRSTIWQHCTVNNYQYQFDNHVIVTRLRDRHSHRERIEDRGR